MQQFSFIAPVVVISGILSAILIALDLRHRPQSMQIMNAVWILTGLWASLPGLCAYYTIGRAKNSASASKMPEMDASMNMADMEGMSMGERDPRWKSVVLSTLHCGAGCTLADLVGEYFFLFIPVAVGGSLVAGSWIIDYMLALLFGIGFQYAAIRGMKRDISRSEAVAQAAQADLLSLTAWQAGMYIWMGIVIFGFNDGEIPSRTSFGFWFMMQIAMYCGLLTALPMNAWLIHKGIKKGM